MLKNKPTHCPKCLHELPNNTLRCNVCGEKVHSPYTKRILLFTMIFTGLCLALSSTFLIVSANRANHSKDKMVERFEQALDERDEGELQKIITHHDGTSISEEEVNALIELVKKKGEVYVLPYFKAVKNNSYFKPYQIRAKKTALVQPTANIELSIKNTDINNLIPGIYKIDVNIAPTYLDEKKTMSREISAAQTELSSTISANYLLPEREVPLLQTEITLGKKTAPLTEFVSNHAVALPVYDDNEFIYTIHYPWKDVRKTQSQLHKEDAFFYGNYLVTPKQLKELKNHLKVYNKTAKQKVPIHNLEETTKMLYYNDRNEITGICLYMSLKNEKMMGVRFDYNQQTKKFDVKEVASSSHDLTKMYLQSGIRLDQLSQQELQTYMILHPGGVVGFDSNEIQLDTILPTLKIEKVEKVKHVKKDENQRDFHYVTWYSYFDESKKKRVQAKKDFYF